MLKPGGLLLFTWSNRMFPTKAIAAWRLASEPERPCTLTPTRTRALTLTLALALAQALALALALAPP